MSINRFAALMAISDDEEFQQVSIQQVSIEVPRTPPTARAPTQAPNAPIRKPYGWTAAAEMLKAAPLKDEFPAIGRAAGVQAKGVWGNGVKSIHDAKDIIAPKPIVSQQEQKRLRYGAARRMLDGVGCIDAQFEGDVTIFFNNGSAEILHEEEDEDQEYQDQECATATDPEWDM